MVHRELKADLELEMVGVKNVTEDNVCDSSCGLSPSLWGASVSPRMCCDKSNREFVDC
jgi:hypothetical protein